MHINKNTKGQSVLEMMMTYSWALLIISIFIAIVFVLSGNINGQQYTAPVCNIQPQLPCPDSELVAYNSVSPSTYFVTFTNNLQVPMFFPTNAFNVTMAGIGDVGTNHYFGNCNPTFALVGSKTTCSVTIAGKIEPPVGTKVGSYFQLTYELCGTNNMMSSCGSSLYKSSGYSTQSISPSTTKLYAISFTANGFGFSVIGGPTDTNALLFLNGVPYTNGQNVIITSTGNYNIYLQTPNGYSISSWSANAGTITPSSDNVVNSTFTMSSANVTIVGTYTSVTCYTCNTGFFGHPTLCPAVCPTLVHSYTYPNNGQTSPTCMGVDVPAGYCTH